MRNYLSGVRTWHRRVAGDLHALDSHDVKQMLRAIDMTLSHTPAPNRHITQDMLPPLIAACAALGPLGPPMKVTLLIALRVLWFFAPVEPGPPDRTPVPTKA